MIDIQVNYSVVVDEDNKRMDYRESVGEVGYPW